jgi:hypothetical protein
MAKAPPKPTRFLVFSAEGNPVADVAFAERARVIASLANGTYRGVSRNEIWILNEEEICVPSVRPESVRPESSRSERLTADKIKRDTAARTARKTVEEKSEFEELERIRVEASARAERDWRDKRETERVRREAEVAAKRAEEKRAEAALEEKENARRNSEFSDSVESTYSILNKPMPVPALPAKLPPAVVAAPEPVHPLLARLKFRSPVQAMTVESLLQEFLHDNAVGIAEHEKKFSELRSGVDLLDQTLMSAALEDFLLKKRPLFPIERKGSALDVRAAIELCRLAILVVPELVGLVAEEPKKAELPKVEAKKKAESPKTEAPKGESPKIVCDWQRPAFIAASPAAAGPDIHEAPHVDSEPRLSGKYISAVPSSNVIPIISGHTQLKAPLLKAESQRRPVLIIGGVEAPEQTAWLRKALGGTVLWKSLPKHAGSSSFDPIVKSVENRKPSAVIMLEELISHKFSDQIKKAAKESGVPYVLGGKAGRGRLEQAVKAIEKYMESHQEAKKS